MSPIAIIQARSGGSRLAGKVLADIEGQPMIARVMDRLSRSRRLKKVVVAIPDTPENDELAAYCTTQKWRLYRGPEDDVLERYRSAAAKFKADPVVRVTADCPLIDWGLVDGCIGMYQTGEFDYVSNNLERTFPHGTDVEVFSAKALREASEHAAELFDREHVTHWILKHQDRPYRLGNLRFPIETLSLRDSSIIVAARLTVDYHEDLELVRAIYAAFPGKDYITISDVLTLLAEQPGLMRLNEQRALDHVQHLSGRFEPISVEQRLGLSRAKAEGVLLLSPRHRIDQ